MASKMENPARARGASEHDVHATKLNTSEINGAIVDKQALNWRGNDVAKFATTFGALGSIWVRLDVRAQLDDGGIPPFLRRAAS
jgi:hypothetical protein